MAGICCCRWPGDRLLAGENSSLDEFYQETDGAGQQTGKFA